MNIEHAGYQVQDPAAMAEWYIRHLGFVCRRSSDAPVPVRFLAKRMTDAFAMVVSGPEMIKGDELAMLRDPWGEAIQLYKRGTRMVWGSDIARSRA